MNSEGFYDFSSRFISSTVRARMVSTDSAENPYNKARVSNLIRGHFESIDFPVAFRQDKGHNFTDVLDTGRAFLVLISDRMKEVLQENGLTGWKTFPIRLFDTHANEVSGYNGFSITGRCGPTYVMEREVLYKQLVPDGPVCKYYKGRHVSRNDWDGSDFFLSHGSLATIVTATAARIIRSSGLTNVRLKNLAEIEVPVDAATLIVP